MMKFLKILLLVAFLFPACAPQAVPASTATQPLGLSKPATQILPTRIDIQASTATVIPPTATATLEPTATATITPTSAPTETIGEMLKTHIVFYLILPEQGRTDACGSISVEPIISKRYRTGDKLEDVQIALEMLFSVGSQFYGAYYNALWQTDLSIASYKYNPDIDEMEIDFTGYLPVLQMSECDKHGFREQVWKTFYHYGFAHKIFTIDGKFLIDQLGR